MLIKHTGNNELTITGNIKSVEDGQEIKQAIDAIQKKGVKSILLKIQDSFSMTSTVIGHLMKTVNIDRVGLSIVVGDRRLYQLLEELSLIDVFNVRLLDRTAGR
ncbi:MAG: hypothetical protein PHN84_11620 [Desulfuromonadaceae bacterium]|nr:hypothetical protein [Desulfuromonadaceae bacterium]MDD2856883.1 hypothetical protein [Desulfuromonadaceae bacterium]